MEYKIENGKAVIILTAEEVEEIQNGFNWSYNECQVGNEKVFNELNEKFDEVSKGLDNGNIH